MPTPVVSSPQVALLVISDLEFGGAQRQAVELANNIDPREFDIHVVSLQDYTPLANSLVNIQSRLHIIKRRSHYDFTVVSRLIRLIRSLDAKLLHAYLFDAEIASRLAARATGIAMIGSERNTNYTFKRSNYLAHRLTAFLNTLVIANSRAGAEFNSRILRRPMSNYRIIHNGVDTSRFSPGPSLEIRRELGLTATDKVVGMFASFKAQKNHPMLLRASRLILDKMPDARFLFVGDELFMGMSDSVEYKKQIRTLANELEVTQRCLFLGNREDVERCYRACDITVIPSLFEGTPNVALESMATEVPVVATNVSDNSYIVPNERAGFIVEVDDIADLTRRVVQLLSAPLLRREMGIAARNWVLQEFTGRRLAQKTARVYHEAIAIREIGGRRSHYRTAA